LVAGFIGLGVGLVSQSLVLRGLGPKSFGDYAFLTNFFNQSMTFLDMGTSHGLYTKLSQRPSEGKLVYAYTFFSLAVTALLGTATLCLAHSPFSWQIWPEQELPYIYLAGFLGAITWFSQILSRMLDAYGLTTAAEKINIVQKVVGGLLIAALFSANLLSLNNYFIYQMVLVAFLLFTYVKTLNKSGHYLVSGWDLSCADIKSYSREFFDYCHPLFIYNVIGLSTGIADICLLQNYGGSIQQGFFALAYQIGAIAFLCSRAMTPLFMRDFSIAYYNHDAAWMRNLFTRYIPILYFTSAYFSCFIAVHASQVIEIIGGEKYAFALIPVAIMALYPVHQTYGQLSGSVFLATGKTRQYSIIGIVFMFLGLPVTYFLLAPADKFGLNAGAIGLAMKTIILQFLAVNTQLFLNARWLKISFLSNLAHQLLTLLILLTVSWLVQALVNHFLPAQTIAWSFFVSGFTYTALVLLIVSLCPWLAGLARDDITKIIVKVRNNF
jgi:O-antigen/teichoic acid export membrane protein